MGYVSLVIAVIAVVVVYFVMRQDPARRALLARSIGFGITAAFTVFFGAFMVGEPLMDPGGWKAAMIIAAWAVPLAALAALAWFRPGWAVPAFAVLATVVIAVSVWFAADPQGWRAFEDKNGPVRAVMTFVLVGALALLGLKRTAASGVLLLVVGVAPPVISGLGSALGFVSLAVVSSAPVITGVLYLLSARAGSRPGAAVRPFARAARGQAGARRAA